MICSLDGCHGHGSAMSPPSIRHRCGISAKSSSTPSAVLVESGERSPYTLEAYHVVCKELIGAFGADRLLTDLRPEDFQRLRSAWAAKWGVVRLAAEVNRAKVVFTWGYKNRQIPAPMFYGDAFEKPSKKMMNLNRAKQGLKMFEPHELLAMIDAASQPMKAMLLLAANAALGNNDIGQLPIAALDLESGWLNFPRVKTGVMRRIPLWPETVAALQAWLTIRPTPATDADAQLFFLSCRGHGWTKGLKNRSITGVTRELLNRLNIGGKRNFYCIRHGFATVGAESLDQIAVNSIMGHSDGTQGEKYREKLPSDRRCAMSRTMSAPGFSVRQRRSRIAPSGIRVAPAMNGEGRQRLHLWPRSAFACPIFHR